MAASHNPGSGGAPPWWSGRVWLLALALLAVLTLGRLPLVDEDEGEYGEVAAELAHAPSWMAPTLNGHPFYEKPILLFWLQAPLVHTFGAQEWALRLPSTLCSVIWVLVLQRWWARRRNVRAAGVAAWLAATSAGVVVVGRASTMDALVTLLLTLCLIDLWDWLAQDQRAPLRRAALWAGLGMLAKGPMTLVIPGTVLAVFLACTPAYRARWRALFDAPAWAVLVAVALPWYAWYGHYSHGEFLRYFLWRENAGRLGGSLQGHGGSVLYFVPVLPLLLLPHTGMLVTLARAVRRLWAEPLERFLLVWFAVVFVLFSLAGTKLPHYLLYGCPPLFLLGGRCLLEARGGDRLRMAFEAAGALALPLAALGLPRVAARLAAGPGNPYLAEMLAQGPQVFDLRYQALAVAWALLALALLLQSWRQRAPRPALDDSALQGRVVWLRERTAADPGWLVVAPGLLSALGISLVLLPALTALQQDPVRAAGRFAATLQVPVVSDDRMPSFSVYLGRATEVREVRTGDVAFGRLDHPERLGQRHEVLFARGGVRVVRVLAP